MMRHRGVILINAISVLLFAFYFFMAIVILDLQPPVVPYVIPILGAAVMCGLAIRIVGEADRASIAVGYALTVVNVVTSCGSAAIIIAHLAGTDSGLARAMNYVPFPR